jgi:hypothetical protein
MPEFGRRQVDTVANEAVKAVSRRFNGSLGGGALTLGNGIGTA